MGRGNLEKTEAGLAAEEKKISEEDKSMRLMWNEGERVTVYEDPQTRKKKEGRAVVIKRHAQYTNRPPMGFYRVAFLSDGAIVDRWIAEESSTVTLAG